MSLGAAILAAMKRPSEPFANEGNAHVLASGLHRRAESAIVARTGAVRAGAAGALDFYQVEATPSHDIPQARRGPVSQRQLGSTLSFLCFRRVEADQSIDAALRAPSGCSYLPDTGISPSSRGLFLAKADFALPVWSCARKWTRGRRRQREQVAVRITHLR